MNRRETLFHHLAKLDDGRASLLLLLLISTDYLFIILHIMNRIVPFDEPRLFRVDIDGSYAEVYQYIKYFWVIILLVYTLGTTRCRGYLAWIVIFFYFLTDDALELHEELGRLFSLAVEMNPPLALRVRDVGELVVFALFAILLMGLLAWAYRRGPMVFKKATKDLLILLGAFAFFVVFIDAVHAALDLGQTMNAIVALVEDGGEMLVASLMVWYVFRLALYKGEPGRFIHESFTRSRDIVEKV